MHIHIKFFALARQLAGISSVELDVPEAATAGDVRARLARKFPDLAAVLQSCTLAVDAHYVRDDALVAPGSEVAVIPPVSGG
jgi:molybdopterin converting factor subunit 1